MDEYTTSRECYETETEIIVIGGVAHDDESHNCDEMGCGSASPHVKYRIKKSELASLRARDDDEERAKLVELAEAVMIRHKAFGSDGPDVDLARAVLKVVDKPSKDFPMSHRE